MSAELEALSKYIRDEIGHEGDIDPSIDLLDARILDSFSVVDIANYIQTNFQVELEAEDLTRDNFASLTNMVQLIELRQIR